MWPTPTANKLASNVSDTDNLVDSQGNQWEPGRKTYDKRTGNQVTTTLHEYIRYCENSKLWPTPTINGNYNRRDCSATSGDGLATAVKMWPTPVAQDAKNSTLPASQLNRDTVPGAIMRMWPTPRASDGTHGGSNQRDSSGNPALPGAVHMWPTPQARDYRSGDKPESIRQERKKEQGWSNNLNDVVKLWPTPRGGEKGVGLCGGTGHFQMLQEGLEDEELVKKMSAGNGGQLNADWVEQLMGFPEGWTNLECDYPAAWQGWPAGIGAEQFDYEPPRVINGQKDRTKRLKTLGNAVVPAQILPVFKAIAAVEKSENNKEMKK